MPQVASRRVLAIAGEGTLVLALLIGAVWYGLFASNHAANPPDYHYLSPAIAVAAGKGFHSAVPIPGSPLDDFLARRTMSLDWEAAASMPIGQPDSFHETTRYLINVVGYWWRVVGISWPSIGAVGAGLHALTVAGTYAVVRVLLPWPFAAAGAIWMCTSTMQLALVPHVRDYSKGAFIIAVLPLVVVLALRCRSRLSLAVAAAATGGLIGIGIGFKMDVAIMLPLAAACVVLLRDERPWSGLIRKAEALAILFAAFFITAGPLLYRMSAGGSNSFHVVLLGFSSSFDVPLGIDRSVYDVLPFYSDGYVANVVQQHSGESQWLAFPSKAYDDAGRALFLDIVRTFPADLLARALGAANTVMNLCFTARDPSFLTHRLPAQDAMTATYAALHYLNGFGVLVAVAFVIIAALGNLRRGILACIVVLVLAGYPALQFDVRHYFHAQIVPVVALLAIASSAMHGIPSLLRHSNGARQSVAPVLKMRSAMLLLAAIVALTLVPLAALRAYQSRTVERAFADYLATRVPLQNDVIQEANGSWLLRWPQPRPTDVPGGPQAAHYVVQFDDDGGARPIHVGLRFDAAGEADYSRLLSVAPSAGQNQIGFTAHSVNGQSAFVGVELGASARARLSGVYRVDSGGPMRLPLDVRLPADWRDRPLYQRLHFEPGGATRRTPPLVVCSTGRGCKGLISYLDRLDELPLLSDKAMSMVHAPIVAAAHDGIAVSGRVDGESSYLYQLRPWPVTVSGAFIAEGNLTEGGAVIGLQKDGRWYAQAFVTSPGPFVVMVPVADAGEYLPMITNAMPPGQRVNRFSIRRAGFVAARP